MIRNLDTSVTLRRIFAAPRDRVFYAWTDPAMLNQWLGRVDRSTPETMVDLRAGGRYRVAMQRPGMPAPFFVVGAFQEVRPPEKLVYTWSFEGDGIDPVETQVTVEFYERGDSTEVVLFHEKVPTPQMRDNLHSGWQECFSLIDTLL